MTGLQDKAGPALGGEEGVGVAALLPAGLVGVLIEGGSPWFGTQEQTAWSLHPASSAGHSQATEGEGEVNVVPGEGAGLLPVQGPDLLGHCHRGHHTFPWTDVTLGSNQHNRSRTRSPYLEKTQIRFDPWITNPPLLPNPSAQADLRQHSRGAQRSSPGRPTA